MFCHSDAEFFNESGTYCDFFILFDLMFHHRLNPSEKEMETISI